MGRFIPSATGCSGDAKSRRRTPSPPTARYTVAPQEVAAQAAVQRRLPSPQRLVWLLLKAVDELSAEEQQLREVLLQEPGITAAHLLARHFLRVVRQRDLAALDHWLAACWASGVAELANYATGLQQDEAAVRAALSVPWSTGPVEGQITKLKLLKRQSYGRAGFALLRKRVLHAA